MNRRLYTWQNGLHAALALLAAGLVIAALLGIRTFSPVDLLILACSILVGILVENYQAYISNKRSDVAGTLSINSIVVFWSTMWLGLPAGVIAGASSSIVAGFRRRDGWRGVADCFSATTVAAFLAAVGYSIGSSAAIKLFPSLAVTSAMISPANIAGLMLMVVFYQISRGGLQAAFDLIDNGEVSFATFRRYIISPTLEHGISLASTLLIFLSFRHFGVEFGLVVLPLSIIAYYVHRLYVTNFAEQTKQLSDASKLHLATVEALATAIDARDQVGMGHIRRIQIYCLGIGSRLGLSVDEMNALRMGALLHDIGNLALPDHILNKPGCLTRAEIEKTKIHPIVGASIVETVGFPYPVRPVVRHHHERWDGTGYPDGLSGFSIPVTARILSVADAYDTMRSCRPYRDAISRDDACKYLRAAAGKKFDPQVVSIFLDELEHFEREIRTLGIDYNQEPPAELLSAGTDETAGHYVEQIKSANREVFSFYSIARDFSSSIDLPQTLAMFTERLADFVPFDTCLIYLFDENGEHASALYVDGLHRDLLEGKRVRIGEGATGFVLSKCKRVENVDPALDFAFYPYQFDPAFRTMAAVPLAVDGKLIGAVAIYSCELTHYQYEHMRLFETVSLIAADAISNSLQHKEAETYALTDPLTGLANARGLQAAFEKEQGRAARSGSTLQLLVLDLDGFKAINDSFGHKVGDRMLVEVGDAIRKQLREYDFLARYGGDEFIAIIPDTKPSDVMDLCRRIERAVEEIELKIEKDASVRVGVSVGAAAFPNHGATFDQVVAAADVEMYRRKRARKERRRPNSGRFLSLRPEKVDDEPRPASRTAEPSAAEFAPTPLFDDDTNVQEPQMLSSQALN